MAALEKASVEATVVLDNGGLAMKDRNRIPIPIPIPRDTIESDYDDEARTHPPLRKNDTNVKKKDEKEEKKKKRDREASHYLPLYRAALQGDWKTASEILQKDSHAMTAKITRVSETVLHIAVGIHHATQFVKELVELVPKEALVLTDDFGRTPLASAAIAGNTKAAKILVNKNPYLPGMRNNRIYTPIHYAARYGHEETVRYLLSVTKDDEEPSPFTGISGVILLNLLITADFYGIALDLVKRNPRLVLDQDDVGETAYQTLAKRPLAFESGSSFQYWQYFVYHVIHVDMDYSSFDPTEGGDVENPRKSNPENCSTESAYHRILHRVSTTLGTLCRKLYGLFWHAMKRLVPCINDIHDAKLMHRQTLQLAGLMCEQAVLSGGDAWKLLEEPLRTAARLGIHEFVIQILKTYPELVWSYDNDKRHSIFHIAVSNRHEKIFSLIYQIGSHKHPVAELKDRDDNNILHLAGMLGPSTRVSGAALQMQRELLWFKEVEKCVQPSYKDKTNKKEKKTPRMLFTEEHNNLVEKGEKWMKDTASSCSVVAALIVTVVFAAAFTVPGGNNDQGTPIFLKTQSFMVFCLSDAIGLFSSSTSVLMFLGILTSRYSEEDFLVSLPRKLIIGLIALFISIASMVVAFSAALYIVLAERFQWILIPIALLGCFPVALFVKMQFPLLVDIFLSTYMSNFNKRQGDKSLLLQAKSLK